MKGVLFTGIVILLMLALYFKFLHNKVTGGEAKSFGFSEE